MVSDKVTRSEEEWKEILSPEQFKILREKGTEKAFTGRLLKNHEDGTYKCAGSASGVRSAVRNQGRGAAQV